MLRRGRPGVGDRRGFTMTELLVVLAIVGILVAIAIPLFMNLPARSRITKAQNDVRVIVRAVAVYEAHMGNLPPNLTALTTPAVNADGISAGPFLGAVPAPPSAAWSAYAFVAGVSGTFTVTISGEGVTVSAP
jgi:prepilin-type N-terminal cleavage/methylation domain-containing protein